MMGLGYIGLPTAALMAAKNLNVHAVDVNPDVVSTINRGEIHIVEPALDGLVKHGVERGYLKAFLEPVSAPVYLIAVPTPFKNDHEPDLAYVESAVKMILPVLAEGQLVVIESTSPVGTTEKMNALVEAVRPELKGKVYFAYCPERVLPGNVIEELSNNDRVIGGLDVKSTELATAFYGKFVKGQLHQSQARTAEMCKLVENASRDVSIAFANELSIICDKAGIDVWELIRLANRHPRVNILQPGTGVGGHCIAVDPWFIVHDFPEEAVIIRKARELNNYKTEWVIEKIKNASLAFELKNKRKPVIACLGLAFKPNIDDLRESPAVSVVKVLMKENCVLKVVEPHVREVEGIEIVPFETAVSEADLVVALVKHDIFAQLRLKPGIEVLDFCGLLNHA
ncbi:MAG: UDP-N-acetyl-D-mannosamine dehydrogenase [Flavobacteriales bacterium]|nr:UDP-N-acetyl-D-mannosamine dehydrogenase [Flavobacteriales bacterium]MCB9447415.1 UDP-N-acetyl-D-mannosamine dehydrogenase [Flavobacteriales bacterium]